jgi:hypothetical protein
MSSEIQVVLYSPSEREHIVAELRYQEEGWGIVSQEGDYLELEIYVAPDLPPLILPLDQLIEALQEAKRILTE